MHKTASVDGVISAAKDASISIMDRGFLYGDSVYEVFRTYDGVPFLMQEHFDRLRHSASLVGMHITQTQDEIIAQIKRVVQASGAADNKEDCYVRYQVTRGVGAIGLYPEQDLKTSLVILVAEIPNVKPEFYSCGMSMAIPAVRRNPVESLDPNIKGGNYMNNILGISQARELGCDDCLFLSHQGFVTEAANSNVWFAINDQLLTADAGNLKGLTKAALHKAMADTQVATLERAIHADELVNTTECFVTSATREVMPVRSLRLENGNIIEFPEGGGGLTRQAAARFKKYIADHIAVNGSLSLFA